MTGITNFKLIDIPVPFRYKFKNYKNKLYPPVYTRIKKIVNILKEASAIISTSHEINGQYELTFEGNWPEVMLWEVPALSVLMELRSRAVLDTMDRFELQILYARAMTKLWEKIEKLKGLKNLKIADFGTRRRHSYLWQDWAVQAMQEGLGEFFIGTSNCSIAITAAIIGGTNLFGGKGKKAFWQSCAISN